MKITIVLGAFLPVPPTMGGAVEKVWLMLGQEFVRRDHQVVMISRGIGQLPQTEIIEGVRHLRVSGFDTPRSRWWLKVLDLIYSIRVKSVLPAADIVVTNTFWLPLLLRDLKKGRVYVHVARYPKGQMRFYGRAARLQAPSTAVARAIAAQAPALAGKTAVIPYPAPRTATDTVPTEINARKKIILFVGRIHPEKGVHLLVDAFAVRARTVFAEWKLMILGPAEERLGGGGKSYLASLRQTAERAGPQVTFAGAVFDAAELERNFRAARLFVYPSLAEEGESFGLAPLEAMAHRSAVLVSDLDCFSDFICENETGFIFDHRSKDPASALGEKIERLVADEILLARVAEAGYRKSTEFSLPRVADRFVDDFHSVEAEI